LKRRLLNSGRNFGDSGNITTSSIAASGILHGRILVCATGLYRLFWVLSHRRIHRRPLVKMPARVRALCPQPRCPNLQPCPIHSRDLRPNSNTRGYDFAWQKLRAQVLAEEPLCRICKSPATDVDHIRPIAEGGPRLSRANLQPLCHKHHSAKTMRAINEQRSKSGMRFLH
jgi:hypothetical protein